MERVDIITLEKIAQQKWTALSVSPPTYTPQAPWDYLAGKVIGEDQEIIATILADDSDDCSKGSIPLVLSSVPELLGIVLAVASGETGDFREVARTLLARLSSDISALDSSVREEIPMKQETSTK